MCMADDHQQALRLLRFPQPSFPARFLKFNRVDADSTQGPILRPLEERVRAAQYVRMSTERQDYSIVNQMAAIESYALLHGFEIVKTYSDPGKSGMDIAHRPGLQKLLQ